ncbi:MAG TPA: cytochrome c [Candidatus Binatia bacterium]
MKLTKILPLVVFILGLFTFPSSGWSQGEDAEHVKRGQYLFAVAGGCACHTIPEKTPHAGGRKFPVPLGTAYSTNITQDKETGLGNWSDEEIYNAMVKGVRPDGQRVLPLMPYEAYSGMAEEDVRDLIAYLRTLKPVRQENPQAKFQVPLARSLGTPLWLMVFGRVSSPPAAAPKSGVERGKYLVEHVALCGDCHTPRNALGVPNRSLYLAGTKSGPFGEEMPNITPDEETGIKSWSRDEIANVLTKGTNVLQDEITGLMAEVVFGAPLGFKDMTREDALAIADYLKSIAPIKNKVR